jgi:sec-independent protein translocase protein TatC
MATRLRPISHEDKLSVVDHLDELRTRLIVCGITLAITFAVCFWQNHRLLEILNKPLEKSTPTAQRTEGGRLSGVAAAQTRLRSGIDRAAKSLGQVATSEKLGTAADRQELARAAAGLAAAAKALPQTVPKRRPITTGVGEPFVTTLTVALWFALIFALPVLLYQLYAFILPAFSPTERKLAFPMMLGVPFLFIAGVAFAYFLVLPPAIGFLQNFNDQTFDVLLQAKDYYRFSIFTLLALGLAFQVPIGALALGRVGILKKKWLTGNWRLIVVAIAIIAAVMPGVDPVTTSILMIPLFVLYGLSILLVGFAERRSNREGEYDPFAAEWDDLDEHEGEVVETPTADED